VRASRRRKGGDADAALYRVLYWGILEMRTTASLGQAPVPPWDGRDPLEHIHMIANTLHHIPAYIDGRPIRPDTAIYAPPFRPGRAGFNWLASLWQVRSADQEAWLVDALSRCGYTVEGLLGTEVIEEIERQRAAILRTMTEAEALDLAAQVSAELRAEEARITVSERDGAFLLMIWTPTNNVPVRSPDAWEYWRGRLLPRRRWRRLGRRSGLDRRDGAG